MNIIVKKETCYSGTEDQSCQEQNQNQLHLLLNSGARNISEHLVFHSRHKIYNQLKYICMKFSQSIVPLQSQANVASMCICNVCLFEAISRYIDLH